MGRKGTEVTEEEKRIIINLHNQCKSLSEIAVSVSRPRSTVQGVINRYSERKTTKNKPRSGRPRKITEEDRRYIVREILKNPKKSAPKLAEEVERTMGKTISASSVS